MFIYNVTTSIRWSIHDDWREWMQKVHMPALINTNCFLRYQLLRLHEQEDTEGPTYTAQYFAESKALYNRYIELYAETFRKEYADKWNGNFVAFRTLLEIID